MLENGPLTPCFANAPGSASSPWPMETLSDLTFPQLQTRMREDGVNPFHATAVFRMVHQKSVAPTELPKSVREWVGEQTTLRPEVVREVASSDGHTRKFVLRFCDGRQI